MSSKPLTRISALLQHLNPLSPHPTPSITSNPPDQPPRPPFSALPLDRSGPHGNAWGLYGPTDQLGTLNKLTPSVIASSAASEIKTGIRVPLDLPLTVPATPSFGRQKFRHQIINKGAQGRSINDDVVEFNTQGSSQWDGLRHYGYQTEKQWYLGHVQADFETSDVLGIDVWVKNGGIVGRGILLDYHDWATRNNITYDPLSRHAIPLSALKAIVAEKNITIKAADILFIRTGFTAAYAALSPEEEPLVSQRKPTPEFVGVEATEEVLRWIWEPDFSAVAGDSTSFELAPSTNPHSDPRFRLHHWLLAGWGMPIGELFNLEDLAKTCKELGRTSFFVSSVPLRVPGGVASPPNAVAIF